MQIFSLAIGHLYLAETEPLQNQQVQISVLGTGLISVSSTGMLQVTAGKDYSSGLSFIANELSLIILPPPRCGSDPGILRN